MMCKCFLWYIQTIGKELNLISNKTYTYKFSVYEHTLVILDDMLIKRKFIVLKDCLNDIVAFTDFHRYINHSRFAPAKRVTDDGNEKSYFICKLLNYVFFQRYNIRTLNEMTVDMISSFLNDYGMGCLPGDKIQRSKGTVEACIRAVMDFVDNYISANGKHCLLKKDDLYKVVSTRNKYGKIIKKKIPVFQVHYVGENKSIFRDMPEAVFRIFFSEIMNYHKDLLMLVALSAFAGLRPSEACNVRRANSPLGHGIRINIVNGEVTEILIDLKKEYNLRSDLISVGSIKKERVQKVYPAFIPAFYECYQIYMDYMTGKKYEAAYGPLTVNKQGKALTYDSYYGKFRTIVKEIIPILLNHADPEVVTYGHLLLEHNISPHIFRHWFSVMLTLFGEDVQGLMYWRGDSVPESALTYLQWKSELEKQYRHINNESFDFLKWKSTKMYGDNYD